MEYYIKILPDGRVEMNGFSAEQNTLTWLQKQVGGHIEVAGLIYPLDKTGYVMLVNEEGKLRGLMPNFKATRLCSVDVIVGSAVLLRTKDEDFAGMDYEEAMEIMQLLA